MNYLIAATKQGCGLQELHCSFETHLLQRRRVRLHCDAVESFVAALERHVVGDERQVVVVDVDAVRCEDVTHFLRNNNNNNSEWVE